MGFEGFVRFSRGFIIYCGPICNTVVCLKTGFSTIKHWKNDIVSRFENASNYQSM